MGMGDQGFSGQGRRLYQKWDARGVAFIITKKFTKIYNFTNNGFPYIHIRKQVDEAEIFEGDQNTLIMTQTYTEDFQCQYMLQRYPFDTQAKTFIWISISSYSQACAIKMDRGSQSAETVLLSALKVFVRFPNCHGCPEFQKQVGKGA